METKDPKKSLSLYELNGSQKFVIAMVVYVEDKVNRRILLLKQTKSSRVVGDNLVGVGGKLAIKSFYGTKEEKIPTKDMMQNIMRTKLNTEDALQGSCREVKEETGLEVLPESLKNIGFSHIRLPNNEIWNIIYYRTNEFSGELIDCNEGELQWYDIDKIPNLGTLPADKIILQNSFCNEEERSDEIFVEAIYGKNGCLRCEAKNDNKTICTLIPDLDSPASYIGEEITVDTTNIEPTFKSIVNILPMQTLTALPGVKSKIREFEYPEYICFTPNKGVENKSISQNISQSPRGNNNSRNIEEELI